MREKARAAACAEQSKAKDSSKRDHTFLGDGDDKEESTTATATVTDVRTFCEHRNTAGRGVD